jgi:hypothetical protein
MARHIASHRVTVTSCDTVLRASRHIRPPIRGGGNVTRDQQGEVSKGKGGIHLVTSFIDRYSQSPVLPRTTRSMTRPDVPTQRKSLVGFSHSPVFTHSRAVLPHVGSSFGSNTRISIAQSVRIQSVESTTAPIVSFGASRRKGFRARSLTNLTFSEADARGRALRRPRLCTPSDRISAQLCTSWPLPPAQPKRWRNGSPDLSMAYPRKTGEGGGWGEDLPLARLSMCPIPIQHRSEIVDVDCAQTPVRQDSAVTQQRVARHVRCMFGPGARTHQRASWSHSVGMSL